MVGDPLPTYPFAVFAYSTELAFVWYEPAKARFLRYVNVDRPVQVRILLSFDGDGTSAYLWTHLHNFRRKQEQIPLE